MFQVLGFWMPGWQELLIVAFIALILFGSRLPKVMKDLGGSVSSFRKGLEEGADESVAANAGAAELK